jgi:RNA polymerase sigma-70 factor (ECF subfamily)
MSLEQLEGLPEESDAERLHDETAVIEQVGAIVRQLKPIDREVILLYLEGMDAASIGEVLGVSAANVAQKVHRTKQLLQRYFRTGD